MSDDTPRPDPSQVGAAPVETGQVEAGQAGSGKHRHRVRRRRGDRQGIPEPEPRERSAESTDSRDPDHVLRGLVGSGPSLLRPDAAMRARDASRPTPEDLAEAEETVIVIRRQYVPTESLPPGIKPARRGPHQSLPGARPAPGGPPAQAGSGG